MGVFWRYFVETLRWPLLLVGGPLAVLVKGAAGSLDQARQDILWLREQFSPETCDEQHVEEHGRSRGIRRHPLEGFERFRARVISAYAWSLLGGKQSGLRKILASYGFIDATVYSLRIEDPQRWAEFRCHLASEVTVGSQDYDLWLWVLNDQKRASAKLAGIEVSLTARGSQATVAAAVIGETIEVYPWSPTDLELAWPVYLRAACQTCDYLTVNPF